MWHALHSEVRTTAIFRSSNVAELVDQKIGNLHINLSQVDVAKRKWMKHAHPIINSDKIYDHGCNNVFIDFLKSSFAWIGEVRIEVALIEVSWIAEDNFYEFISWLRLNKCHTLIIFRFLALCFVATWCIMATIILSPIWKCVIEQFGLIGAVLYQRSERKELIKVGFFEPYFSQQ